MPHRGRTGALRVAEKRRDTVNREPLRDHPDSGVLAVRAIAGAERIESPWQLKGSTSLTRADVLQTVAVVFTTVGTCAPHVHTFDGGHFIP